MNSCCVVFPFYYIFLANDETLSAYHPSTIFITFMWYDNIFDLAEQWQSRSNKKLFKRIWQLYVLYVKQINGRQIFDSWVWQNNHVCVCTATLWKIHFCSRVHYKLEFTHTVIMILHVCVFTITVDPHLYSQASVRNTLVNVGFSYMHVWSSSWVAVWIIDDRVSVVS